MSIIKIYQTKSKQAKKKPGWKQQEAEYQAWLNKVNSQTLFSKGSIPKMKSGANVNLIVSGPVVEKDRLQKHHSKSTPGGSGTKPVARPEITYKDNPEMLERELKARERKFNTAPAYNKGGDVYITDEMMKDITAGKTRRR